MINIVKKLFNALTTTGCITTKVDVFSFGVILMEIITGRKAIDENNVHLVSWFRRMYVKEDSFEKIIDPTINHNNKMLTDISGVSRGARKGNCPP